MRLSSITVVSALLGSFPAITSAEPVRATVVEVVTATGDVHDAAAAGDTVLLATSGGLVLRRAGEVIQTLTSRDGLPGTRLRSVTVLQDRVIWVSSIEGVAQLGIDEEGRAEVLRTFPLRRVTGAARFAGATWFTTYGFGLHRLTDGEGNQPVRVVFGSHPTHERQTSIAVSNSELLVGTAGAGIFRLGTDGRQRGRLREVHGLADDFIWSLVPDGDRVIVATAGGVSLVRNRRVVRGAREARISGRMPVRDIRAVLPREGGLFVAAYGGGVYRIERSSTAPVRVEGGGRRLLLARALVETSDGVLVGHTRGAHLIRRDGAVQALALGALPSGDVTSMARAFDSLWVGTFTHGLARIEAGRVSREERALARWGLDRRINDLAVTDAGTAEERLWIATDRGLFWHDGRRFVRVEETSAPSPSEHTTSLHVQSEAGALWVASSRQLARWSSGRWQSWTGERRLPIVNLHSVTSDRGGNIWVGSLHGLFRFDPAAGTFERHSVSTGELPVDWVTAVEPWEEGIVAGTYHGGLSWFDGETFRIEREDPEGGLPSGWVNPHAMTWTGDVLWIGTLERGLAIGRDGHWIRLDLEDGLPSRDVTAIYPIGENSAWVGTRGGLARVEWQ